MLLNTRNAFICVLIACGLACAQEIAESPAANEAAAVVRDKLLVPVYVNGTGPHRFILDLGIDHPVLARELAATLMPGGDANPPAQEPQPDVHVQELRVGDTISKPLRAFVMDLSSFKSTLGVEVSGILNGRELGADIEIDLDGKTVRFPMAPGNGANSTDSRSVRLRVDENGQPVVSALINGKHVRTVAIDSTFGGVMAMPESTLRDLGLFTPAAPGTDDVPALRLQPPPEAVQSQLPPAPEIMQIRLKSIRVGGVEIQAPICSALPSGEAARIGLGFLKGVKAGLDFANKTIRLEGKGASPIVCEPIVGFGLVPGRCVDGYWNLWVAKDSPAYKANIRSGAVLLESGGSELKDASYCDVSEKLTADAGATCSVTVLQNGEKRTVALTSQPLL